MYHVTNLSQYTTQYFIFYFKDCSKLPSVVPGEYSQVCHSKTTKLTQKRHSLLRWTGILQKYDICIFLLLSWYL